jgi:hypothetical protein
VWYSPLSGPLSSRGHKWGCDYERREVLADLHVGTEINLVDLMGGRNNWEPEDGSGKNHHNITGLAENSENLFSFLL